MNILEVNKRFKTKEDCLAYLEKLRWGKTPVCPYCNSTDTHEAEHRHHCRNCLRNFSVLVGTAFQEMHLDLPTLFNIITLMLNAKTGISASEIGRNLDIPVNTAWYACMRVRCGMSEAVEEMRGKVEMDEAYLAGKPRKENTPTISSDAISRNKRGRGTSRPGITGMVERGGKKRVIVKVMKSFNSHQMLIMLHKHLAEDKATVITDAARHYRKFDDVVAHKVIVHKENFVKGNIHTNTIDGFWGHIKNSVKGSYKAMSRKYLPFYLTEFCYKYNHRTDKTDNLKEYLQNALHQTNCMLNYQPVKTYKRKLYKPKSKKK